jgi:uncharacterized protein (DUF2236 family)
MHISLILRPWAGARAQGRIGFARLLFLMQISLVFWPAAVRAAYRLEQERQKQGLLDALAAANANAVPVKPFPMSEAPIGRGFLSGSADSSH